MNVDTGEAREKKEGGLRLSEETLQRKRKGKEQQVNVTTAGL